MPDDVTQGRGESAKSDAAERPSSGKPGAPYGNQNRVTHGGYADEQLVAQRRAELSKSGTAAQAEQAREHARTRRQIARDMKAMLSGYGLEDEPLAQQTAKNMQRLELKLNRLEAFNARKSFTPGSLPAQQLEVQLIVKALDEARRLLELLSKLRGKPEPSERRVVRSVQIGTLDGAPPRVVCADDVVRVQLQHQAEREQAAELLAEAGVGDDAVAAFIAGRELGKRLGRVEAEQEAAKPSAPLRAPQAEDVPAPVEPADRGVTAKQASGSKPAPQLETQPNVVPLLPKLERRNSRKFRGWD